MGFKALSDSSSLICFGCLLHFPTPLSPTGTPLPRIVHKKVSRREVCFEPGGRLVIVGDVHGCVQELRQLLVKIGFVLGRDSLVLVGDLVNKGPSSGEVLRLAQEHKALCVRGNHDDELLEAWFQTGRYTGGLSNYTHDALHQVSWSDIRWLQEQPLSLSFHWLSLVVVHAGLVPGVPLKRQGFKDLLWIRDLCRAEDGTWKGVQKPVQGSVAWAEVWEGPEHVIFGHDAKRKLQHRPFATGLDTGCCYGYELTALVVDPESETRTLVQVPADRMYSEPVDKLMRPPR